MNAKLPSDAREAWMRSVVPMGSGWLSGVERTGGKTGGATTQNRNRATTWPDRGGPNTDAGFTRPKPEVGTPAELTTGGASALVESGLLNWLRLKTLKNSPRTSNDMLSRIRNSL